MTPVKMTPEEKVRRAMEMTEAVTSICVDGIRGNDPGITEQELMTELRRRIDRRERT